MALIAAYSFDEGTGTTAADSSGHGRALTVAASAWTASGRTGSALVGLTSGPVMSAPTSLPALAAGTVAWWSTGGGWDWILGASPATDGTGVTVAGGRLYLEWHAGGAYVGYAWAPVPTDGAWHHYAVTWTAASTAPTLYVDGALTSWAYLAGTWAGVMVSTAGVIVASPLWYPTEAAAQGIDDLRVFDTALTATDVLTYMNTPVGGGGSSYSGAVSLSGTGVLTATGRPALSGVAGMSGAGTLALSGHPAALGTLALSGGGTLVASGSPAVARVLALDSTGTLTPGGMPATSGTVELAGPGVLTLGGGGAQAASGSLSLAGSGELALSGTPGTRGTLPLDGGGTLAATGSGSQDGAGHLGTAGAGTLALTGTPAATGALALSGTGTLGLSSGRRDITVHVAGPTGRTLRADGPVARTLTPGAPRGRALTITGPEA